MTFRFYVIVFYLLLISSSLIGVSVAASELESDVERKGDSLHLLFLCTGNSCRSQMAEGWARSLASEPFLEVKSAGIAAYGLNPRAIQVMREVGVDITKQTSKILTLDMIEWADTIVTVCGDADESCPLLPGRTKKIHWPIFDPAKAVGSAEEILEKFREVRNELKDRIKILLEDLRAHKNPLK